MRFVPKNLRDIKNPAHSCLTATPATYISEIVGRNVAEIHFPLPEILGLSNMFLTRKCWIKMALLNVFSHYFLHAQFNSVQAIQMKFNLYGMSPFSMV